MRIGFVSNFMNHHQKPVADCIYNMLGSNYAWIATTPTDEFRINLGYEDLNEKLPYVICSYKSKEEHRKALDFCINCDCLVVAYDFENIVKKRMKLNKLTFYCSERIYKKGLIQYINPKIYLSCLKTYTRYRNKSLYFLSIGEYSAKDMNLLFAFPRKKYRWGYFTEVEDIDSIIEKDKRNNKIVKIFWAGRFIDWKHPEYIVLAAKKLKEKGIAFEIEMAGEGNLKDSISHMIESFELNNCVKLLGPIDNKEVRKKMLESDIFCLTSNKQEGWGAVVSEALSTNNIVICSNKCGAGSSLIKDGINGLTFKDNNMEDFCNKLINSVENFESFKNLAHNGYLTMKDLWNPAIASFRLIELIKCVLDGNDTPFLDGPCSKVN